jgi:hypothetical protein
MMEPGNHLSLTLPYEERLVDFSSVLYVEELSFMFDT